MSQDQNNSNIVITEVEDKKTLEEARFLKLFQNRVSAECHSIGSNSSSSSSITHTYSIIKSS